MEGRKIDPTFYPAIYGADETDDWTDPEVWKKANPSLGTTVDIDKIKAACESAKQNPGDENSFRQLRLNLWVKQAVRWIKADKEKSTEKIDGAVATIMGLDRAIRCGNTTGASVYDDRGILFNQKWNSCFHTKAPLLFI